MKIKVKVLIGSDSFESKCVIDDDEQFPAQADDIAFDVADMFSRCIRATHLSKEDVLSYVSTILKQKTSTEPAGQR